MQLNHIYNEDCLKTMARMPDGFVDLTVTSPPYDGLRDYEGFVFDFPSIAEELYRVTKKGGVVVWVVADQTIDFSETGTSFRQALFFMDCGFNLHDTMIYLQKGTGAKGSNLSYWQGFEYMFVFSKGKPKTVNRINDIPNKNAGKKRGNGSAKLQAIKTRMERGTVAPQFSIRSNVWSYSMGQNDKTLHPAVFPEALAADHIFSWSNVGDVVFDPFIGSGTTGKMAFLLKRNWLGSEVSEKYTQEANKRLEAYRDLKIDRQVDVNYLKDISSHKRTVLRNQMQMF